MPAIKFKDHSGSIRTVKAPTGISLMEAARRNGIPGIDAECGGVCACATCHVYVDSTFAPHLNPRTDCEEPMLQFLSDVRANSRLACQVEITDLLDGLEVETPESQEA